MGHEAIELRNRTNFVLLEERNQNVREELIDRFEHFAIGSIQLTEDDFGDDVRRCHRFRLIWTDEIVENTGELLEKKHRTMLKNTLWLEMGTIDSPPVLIMTRFFGPALVKRP